MSGSDLFTRRDFLGRVGVLMATSPFVLWCERARSMTPFAFWKKRGSAANGTYPTDTGDDPYWDYVVLLMNMDTPTPSTGFTTVFADESNVGKTPTVSGSPYIDAGAGSSPYSGRTGSGKFNGSSDSVSYSGSTVFDFGSGAFTIEGWIYSTGLNTRQTIATNQDSSGLNGWCLRTDSTAGTGLDFNSWGSSQNYQVITSGLTLSANTWYHVAVVRSGDSHSIYVNGTSYASLTFSGAAGSSSSALKIVAPFATTGSPTNKYWNGSLADLRIYKGIAKYTANFTPPTTPIGLGTANDKYWGYCVLACPFENSLKDMSGKRAAINGAAALTTTQKKFGTASGVFGGADDYLNLGNVSDFDFGTSDFSIEAWFWSSDSVRVNQCLISQESGGWSGNKFALYARYNSNLSFWVANYSASTPLLSHSTNLQDSSWHHVAVTRRGHQFQMFVDGILVSSATLSASVGTSTSPTWIGNVPDQTSRYFNGYIDSIRITKGYARYTSNFTPPTASFPVGKDETVDPFWTYTTLAMRMDDFTDARGRQTVNNINSVTINTGNRKFGGGSAQLNGTSNYLTIASNADFTFGTSDYTAEAWVYFTASPVNRCILGQWPGYGASPNNWLIQANASSKLQIAAQYGTYATGVTTLTTNTWYHVALVRSGSNHYCFLNGSLECSASASANHSAQTTYLGSQPNDSYFFPGHLDDVRITKGVARYINNFTPPTREFATTQYTPYSGTLVTSGLVCRLDAGESGSYDGSSQTWSNLVASPADGAAKAAYDFYRGSSSSSESSDPTFIGVSGGLSANDYFSFDGGDYFTLVGSNTAFFDSLHKSSASFTLLGAVVLSASYTPSGDAIISTRTNGYDPGLTISISSTRTLSFYVSNSSTDVINVSSARTLVTGWNVFAISYDGSGARLFYINGVDESIASTYSSPSSSSSSQMRIGITTELNTGRALKAGVALGMLSFYNRALSNSELDQNFNTIRGRFGI